MSIPAMKTACRKFRKKLGPAAAAIMLWDYYMGMENRALFEEEIAKIKAKYPDRLFCVLRYWVQRMKVGDLFLG